MRLLGQGDRYTAIKLSPDMARQCQANLTGLSSCAVAVLTADCRVVELAADSVDGIFGTNFLYFLDDVAPFLARARAWLKPG